MLKTSDFDGDWDNPREISPIPRPCLKWTAVAIERLAKALSARSDCPSEFANGIKSALRALQLCAEEIQEWKPLNSEIEDDKGNKNP